MNINLLTWARPLFTAIIFIIGIHIIISLNKGYLLSGSFYSPTKYNLLIKSLPSEDRSDTFAYTQVSYFGILPEWTPNVFYGIYFLLAATIIMLYNFQSVQSRKRIKDKGAASLKEFGIELLAIREKHRGKN